MLRRTILIFLLSTIALLTTEQITSQNVSQASYQVLEELDVKVTMRDGIRLSTNIYRPNTSDTFPVLLARSPYGNGGAGNRDAHYFASRGYVVVVQDTRGRGESEGIFNANQHEALDGYDTQQWIGEQAWCNGKIGTFGGSYVGFTQWMPAQFQSPYLVTMVPTVTFSDLHDVVYQNGAFRLDLFTPWSIEMTRPYNLNYSELAGKMDSILLTLPLIEQDRAMGWRVSFLRDWLLHPKRDLFWKRTSVGNYNNIKASVYNIGGWYDILLGGTIENYKKMTAPGIDPGISSGQKLLIGPWIHNMGRQEIGELDFGEESAFKSTEIRLRWFDSQLKGLDNGIMEEPPVKIFVMGINQWRHENEWPLARTDYRNYYFHSRGNANTLEGDGRLVTKPSKKDSQDKFDYHPEDPVPTVGTMGPFDQRSVEGRQDVLVYTTPPLKKDLEVTGPVKAVIYASSSAENTDFTAKLVDVHPDGMAIRICEGIIRADHRDTDAPPSNILPGEQMLCYYPDGTVKIWADKNASDSPRAKSRYAHPFYQVNMILSATGYNLIVLGGI